MRVLGLSDINALLSHNQDESDEVLLSMPTPDAAVYSFGSVLMLSYFASKVCVLAWLLAESSSKIY